MTKIWVRSRLVGQQPPHARAMLLAVIAGIALVAASILLLYEVLAIAGRKLGTQRRGLSR